SFYAPPAPAIYTLSLHDALPIFITDVTTDMPRSRSIRIQSDRVCMRSRLAFTSPASWMAPPNRSSFSVSVVLPASGCEMIAKVRSEEHTSELQSRENLVCRLLLE